MTMKKFLLTTTALTAITSIVTLGNTPTAQAEWEVKLGGFVDTQFGFWSDNYQNIQTNREMRNHVEIHLSARNTAQVVGYGEIAYGVQIELQSIPSASPSNIDFDEAHMFMSGEFGEVQLGDEDGASDTLAVIGPTNTGSGLIDGDYSFFVTGVPIALKVTDSDDATKITYFTPVIEGFIAGISYAFETNEGGKVLTNDNDPGRKHDFIEVGAKYTGEANDMKFSVGGGISFHSQEAGDGASNEDFFNWQLGAQATTFGLTIGGVIVDYSDARGPAGGQELGFHGSVTYENGPISFGGGVSYLNMTDTSVALLFIGGATYKIADGLSVYGEGFYYDRDEGDFERDGVGALMGITVKF